VSRDPAEAMWRETINAFNREGGVSIARRGLGGCDYTCVDALTDRALYCDKDAGHDGIHRLVLQCAHWPLEGKCRHCHDDPPPGHTCPSCGRAAS